MVHLNALLSLFIVLSVFSSLFSIAMARETAYYHALGQDDHVRKVIRIVFLVSLSFSALYLLFGTLASAKIAQLLQIDNHMLVVFTVLGGGCEWPLSCLSGCIARVKAFCAVQLGRGHRLSDQAVGEHRTHCAVVGDCMVPSPHFWSVA